MKYTKDFFVELLRETGGLLPWALAFVGFGVYLAEVYQFDGKAGLLLGAVCAVCASLYAIVKTAAFGKPQDQVLMQAEIDRAYRDGFKVWFLIPQTDIACQDYLDKLRANGYMLTDRNGRAIDTAAEVHDSPTRRRKRFRIIESNDQDQPL